MTELEYEVKALPNEWCQFCSLNGCYPWNRNPFLLCSEMGGLHPAIYTVEGDKRIACLSCKPASSTLWEAHLSDLKREAKLNEEVRLRAMEGKVLSNQLLPAEYVMRLMKK